MVNSYLYNARLFTNQKLYSLVDETTVTVSLQPREKEPCLFVIHKHLLFGQSRRFREFFEGQDDETKVMILWEVGAEEFEAFSTWLYT